jgi:hypothetical protein
VTRWLSALPFRRRQQLVTTDGEFTRFVVSWIDSPMTESR